MESDRADLSPLRHGDRIMIWPPIFSPVSGRLSMDEGTGSSLDGSTGQSSTNPCWAAIETASVRFVAPSFLRIELT